jgi:preprotein translocase subunit SecA
MLSRLNIDEGMPIESGIIGRLVESAQTRVEGANFDVREHLLEYDDVLNDQRERIYEQREKIFDKEDLREDVTEMLRTEVSRRIQEGLQDEEGLWKLLAYLDDIQPPIDQAGDRPSILHLESDHGRSRAAAHCWSMHTRLLEIAAESMAAWHEHLRNWAVALIQNAQMGFENQLAERLDALDTFVEGLGYEETDQRRDIKAELSGLVHVPLRLTDEDMAGLEGGAQDRLTR